MSKGKRKTFKAYFLRCLWNRARLNIQVIRSACPMNFLIGYGMLILFGGGSYGPTV